MEKENEKQNENDKGGEKEKENPYIFFNYHRFVEKRLQFKRPIIRQKDYEKYYYIPIRYRNQEIYIKT